MVNRRSKVRGIVAILAALAILAGAWIAALMHTGGASGESVASAPSTEVGAPSAPSVSASSTAQDPSPLAPAPSVKRVVHGVDLNVPWAVGGPRYERTGELRDYPGQWPTVPVRALRLWDTRTAWLNLEPARDVWDFHRLDAFVLTAETHGVSEVTLVLGGTPLWAASTTSSSDAVWLGPGSASPPRDLADWTDFVAKVAERYRGRIDAYEIWNEPTDPAFWSGTRAQWTSLVATAAVTIHALDPWAKVVAPGIAYAQPADVERSRPWLKALSDSGARIDVVSMHFYPTTKAQAHGLRGTVTALRSMVHSLRLNPILWITEANVIGGSRFSRATQSDLIGRIAADAERARVSRVFWYAWTDLTSPDLIQFQPGTAGARELRRLARLAG